MKLKFKIALLMALFLIIAYLIIQALMSLAEIEASKADDYFFVKTGWVRWEQRLDDNFFDEEYA